MQRIIILLLLAAGLVACTDLDIAPRDLATADVALSTPQGYTSFIAKLYAGFVVTGQEGPTGQADISSVDEGFGNYIRLFWKMQELPTETAVIAWNDNRVRDLNNHLWATDNQYIRAMYYRIFYQVSLANEFIRESTPEQLEARGIREDFRPEVATYRAEARFLRALSYWHAIDFFGDVIFYTEEQTVGGSAPEEMSRQFVFDFIVSELAEIEDQLPAAADQQYGRVNREALNMLQAKLFQNAGVYTGMERHAEATAALEKVIDSGTFALAENYQYNFLADNNLSPELIWANVVDGESSQSFGSTIFLTRAPVGGDMVPADYGIDGGWAGLRVTPEFVDLFEDGADSDDSRAIFFTEGQSKAIPDVTAFSNGYASPKYQNVTRDGVAGSNIRFSDVDFPMFRLADAYLMYAESVLRGGGGDRGRALNLVNELRERAYGDDDDNISDEELTLDFILDERARELYWEGHRRTDRIRFGEFTDAGIWAWKGRSEDDDMSMEMLTSSSRNLYPIPESELIANPALSQNEGY